MILCRRSQEGQEVDAGMPVEACVLIGLQHREIARIDIGGLDRKPPASILRRERAQQLPVPVEYHGRAVLRNGQVERPQALGEAPQRQRRDENGGHEDCRDDDSPPQPLLYAKARHRYRA